jgi:Putative ABC exporter
LSGAVAARDDLAAVAYVEFRQAFNRVRMILRQPARFLIYVVAIAYFVLLTVARTVRPQPPIPIAQIPEPFASAVLFAYLALVGFLAANAASGMVGGFASPAEARFLIGSHLHERTVITWVQLRRSCSTLLRNIVLILFSIFVIGVSFRFLGLALSWIAGALVISASGIPALKLGVAVGRLRIARLFAALAIAAFIALTIVLASLAVPVLATVAHELESLGGGLVVNELAGGNAPALGAFYALAVMLSVASFFCGRGLYPELYAASVKTFAVRERMRRESGAFKAELTYATSGPVTAPNARLGAPGAAWAMLWKERLGFTRSGSLRLMFAISFVASALAGAIFGQIVASFSRDPGGASIGFLISFAPVFIIFTAVFSTVGLREDIAKPLWWMGGDPLWMRLFAWLAVRSWWPTACLAVGLITWSAAIRLPAFALGVIPPGAAVILNLRAVGLALYALFPSANDQRGPLAILKIVLAYVALIPPALGGLACSALLHNAATGTVVGVCATALVEAALLVGFAAWRITGRGLAVAQAEAM